MKNIKYFIVNDKIVADIMSKILEQRPYKFYNRETKKIDSKGNKNKNYRKLYWSIIRGLINLHVPKVWKKNGLFNC